MISWKLSEGMGIWFFWFHFDGHNLDNAHDYADGLLITYGSPFCHILSLLCYWKSWIIEQISTESFN